MRLLIGELVVTSYNMSFVILKFKLNVLILRKTENELSTKSKNIFTSVKFI